MIILFARVQRDDPLTQYVWMERDIDFKAMLQPFALGQQGITGHHCFWIKLRGPQQRASVWSRVWTASTPSWDKGPNDEGYYLFNKKLTGLC